MTALEIDPTHAGEFVSKRIHLDAELASWLDEESAQMGISPSMLVGTLLEWARTEHITRDADMMVFAC
ncbi:hypothetical protein FEM03_15380 [Phragmitibacter flavus]|uniref:Uncharacterized protein n=1 Tax=Phragmitibacter flavus TaxID=2576071 RepID=A0A5R8KBM4_9BACT|nr:hypothetical protein [Phragmitibacter flavus]TLD69708.1 hypothetical protein FEM03_15380 [Phragmitibacter flavus]